MITDKLDILIDAELVDLGNCVDMLWLHFGKQDDCYCLHIQAGWTIYQNDTAFCSKDDLYTDVNNGITFHNCFTEYEMRNSVFCHKKEILINEYLPLRVIKISISQDNRMSVKLDRNFSFDVTENGYGDEMWRFFKKGDHVDPHIVAYFDRLVEE